MAEIGNVYGEEGQKFQGKVYEQQWAISDWYTVQQNENTLEAQSFEFKTGNFARVLATWKMGFQLKNSTHFCVYWKLLKAKGFPDKIVKATISWTLLKGDFTDEMTDTKERVINVGQTVEVPEEFRLKENLNYWGININPNGELVCKLKLTIMEPVVPSVDTRLTQFHNSCLMQLGANLASLLGDEATADLKIVTSDAKMLCAHKLILKAQCPVFESMFRSGMSETKTGVVNVEDINAKTMGIFLHFFYSGELLPSWKDNDTVVEFTYAVGKYQLNNILIMLDNVLGCRDEEDATHIDVQLLDLAVKLNLKTAELELMERIKKTLCKANSGSEFLALWTSGHM